MTGGDWVWILIMAGFLTLVFCLDRITNFDRREASRLDRDASERRYRDERERLP